MATRQFPVIDDGYEIELDDPDDPTAIPVAYGSTAGLHRAVIPGRYTGSADRGEGEGPVPVHVVVEPDRTLASHRDDPRGIAHPDRGRARRALLVEMDQEPPAPGEQEPQLG